MIDFHSHILWGVDDGSKSYNETLNMIEEAKKVGFDKIISTSHYKENRFEVPKKDRKKLIKQIKDVGVQIYLASEIYLTDNLFKLLKSNKAIAINDSRYILIEFSLKEYYKIPVDIIETIRKKQMIPIIAHPERYLYIQQNPEYARELVNAGAYLQSNYGSIIGLYGSSAKETMKILLNENLIAFLGSDCHRRKSNV